MSTPDTPDDPALRDPGQPAPYYGYGGAPTPYPGPQPWGGQAPAYPGAPYGQAVRRRPGNVTAALIMCWIGAGVFLLLGLSAVALAANSDFLDGVEQSLGQPVDQATVTGLLRGVGALMSVWSVAVAIVAAFAWRRRSWARTTLTVMGCLYALLLLLSLFQGVALTLIPIAWVAGCVGLLWTGSARPWFAANSADASAAYNLRPPAPW